MKAPTSPSVTQRSNSWQAISTSSTFNMPMPLRRLGAVWQKSAIQLLYAAQSALSSSVSGRRYQKRPWLGCKHAPQTPSIPVHGEFLQHGLGLVCRLSDVLPHTEEVDRRGVFEALARLDHRAHRPDADAIDVPGIVLPARARAMPFHTRRPVAELRFDIVAV